MATQNVAVSECTICLEPLLSSPDTRRLPCGHRFHNECFVRWHVEQQDQDQVPKCSYCRQFYLMDDEETLWQVYVGTRNEMVQFLRQNHSIKPTSTEFTMNFTPPFTVDERQEEFVAQLLFSDMTLRRRIYQVSHHFQPGWVCMPIKTPSERWGPSSPEPNRDTLDIPEDHWSRQPPHPEIEWWDGIIFTLPPEAHRHNDAEDEYRPNHVWPNPSETYYNILNNVRQSTTVIYALIAQLSVTGEWTSDHRAAFTDFYRVVRTCNMFSRRASEGDFNPNQTSTMYF